MKHARTAAVKLLIVFWAAVVPVLQAQAQSTASVQAAPPPLSPTEQTIKDLKNPASWLTWGADFRARAEIFDNILTLNPENPLHEQSYLRFRSRIYASLTPVEDLSLNVRVANEAREWLRPAGYTPYSPSSGWDWRDGIIDALNIQWRNMLSQPLTLTFGRQDFLPGTPSGLGDGWLIGEGTPYDGSWTYFLDAARVTWDLKDQRTRIDAVGLMQDPYDNGMFQTINANQYLPLTEQDEKGAILWVANKSLPTLNMDGYFIYKHDDANVNWPFGSAAAAKYRPDKADIYTLGGRLSGIVHERVKYSVEGAYEFGEKQDPSIKDAFASTGSLEFRDISAFGVNTKVGYLFTDSLNNQLHLSYEFLSGDDPNSKSDEMFDNLWGRYPRWGEMGLYSFAAETRIGNEANLHRFGPTWNITPLKNLDFSASYYALLASEEVATRGVSSLFAGNSDIPDHGTFRGHFMQAVVKYKLGKHVTGHLWSEFEFPGNYYVHRTTWYFLRPEIMFTF